MPRPMTTGRTTGRSSGGVTNLRIAGGWFSSVIQGSIRAVPTMVVLKTTLSSRPSRTTRSVQLRAEESMRTSMYLPFVVTSYETEARRRSEPC